MKTIYQYFTRTIAAGGIAELNIYSRFLILISNSSSSYIKISIAQQGFEKLPVGLSIGLPETDTFNIVQFRNDTLVSMDIVFAVSNGNIVYSPIALLSATLTDIFNELKGVATNSFARIQVSNAAATVIKAASATRKSIKLCASPDNTDDIYIGYDNTVTNVKFVIKLVPGQTIELTDYLGAIYGWAVVNNEVVSYGEVA